MRRPIIMESRRRGHPTMPIQTGSGMDTFTLRGHAVLPESVVENAFVTVRDGFIASVDRELPAGANLAELPEDCLILPGFRDPHTHDVLGQLDSAGRTDGENAERFAKIAAAYASHGVTEVCAATFGAPVQELEHYCRGAKRWMDDSGNGADGARLAGINIEGSFINEHCRGAQSAEFCFIPGRDDCIGNINRLHATGAVKMMNIVPDYGEPSLEAIRHARGLGIMVGSGHLRPPADLLRRAYGECGLQYMVHFTNGPTGQSFKPFGGGNAFEGAMSIPIVKELILDLIHVDPRYVLDMIARNEQRWGENAIIAITDSSFPIEEEIPEGEFRIGTTFAQRDAEHNCLRAVAYARPDGTRRAAPPNTLCGSILTMDRAFGNLLSLFTRDIEGIWFDHPAMPLDQALVKTAHYCAATQAALEGRADVGRIAPGLRADLTAARLERRNGAHHLAIEKTYAAGRQIHSAA